MSEIVLHKVKKYKYKLANAETKEEQDSYRKKLRHYVNLYKKFQYGQQHGPQHGPLPSPPHGPRHGPLPGPQYGGVNDASEIIKSSEDGIVEVIAKKSEEMSETKEQYDKFSKDYEKLLEYNKKTMAFIKALCDKIKNIEGALEMLGQGYTLDPEHVTIEKLATFSDPITFLEQCVKSNSMKPGHSKTLFDAKYELAMRKIKKYNAIVTSLKEDETSQTFNDDSKARINDFLAFFMDFVVTDHDASIDNNGCLGEEGKKLAKEKIKKLASEVTKMLKMLSKNENARKYIEGEYDVEQLIRKDSHGNKIRENITSVKYNTFVGNIGDFKPFFNKIQDKEVYSFK